MQSRVNREDFLAALGAVKPGLAAKEVLQQSMAFAFRAGEVMTYNDEVCCRGPSGLPDSFTGVVRADKLLELLTRLDEDSIKVSYDGGELRIAGKRRSAGFKAETKISLPVDAVERPEEGDWKPLSDNIVEALNKVQACAAKEEADFKLSCVNIAPGWVESTDLRHACRWDEETGFTSPFLIKKSSGAAVAGIGATQFAEGSNWVHFRSKAGFVLSCRRYVEDYPSEAIGNLLKQPGTRITLPKGLAEAAEKAGLFSQDTPDDDLLDICITADRLTISGYGASGWYSQYVDVVWAGADTSFLIAPQMLIDLVKAYNDVSVTETTLRVDGGPYRYVTRLTVPAGQEPSRPDSDVTEEDGDDDE